MAVYDAAMTLLAADILMPFCAIVVGVAMIGKSFEKPREKPVVLPAARVVHGVDR